MKNTVLIPLYVIFYLNIDKVRRIFVALQYYCIFPNFGHPQTCYGSKDREFNRTILKENSRYPQHSLLLQDVNLIEKLSHFVQERTLNRRSFSLGTGAFGYFECTLPNAQRYSRAKLFDKVGKRTPIVVRIAPGSARYGAPQPPHNDAYGFCVRFFTEEGNWDLLTMNFPLSPLRDPMRSPESAHANQEDPASNLNDPNRSLDFLTSNLQGLHSFTWQYSDIGLPLNWRLMSGHSLSSLSFMNEKGKIFHVRFTLKAKRKYKYMDAEMAHYMRSHIPDYYMRDLYVSIKNGDFPEWFLIAQILTPEAMEKIDFDPFDPTKVREISLKVLHII